MRVNCQRATNLQQQARRVSKSSQVNCTREIPVAIKRQCSADIPVSSEWSISETESQWSRGARRKSIEILDVRRDIWALACHCSDAGPVEAQRFANE